MITDEYKTSNEMKQDIKKILEQFKYGNYSIEQATNELLSLLGVSQQRELLNALADNFNESTHTYIMNLMIEKTLKEFNSRQHQTKNK